MTYSSIEINREYGYAKIVWSDGTKMIITVKDGEEIAAKYNVSIIEMS